MKRIIMIIAVASVVCGLRATEELIYFANASKYPITVSGNIVLRKGEYVQAARSATQYSIQTTPAGTKMICTLDLIYPSHFDYIYKGRKNAGNLIPGNHHAFEIEVGITTGISVKVIAYTSMMSTYRKVVGTASPAASSASHGPTSHPKENPDWYKSWEFKNISSYPISVYPDVDLTQPNATTTGRTPHRFEPGKRYMKAPVETHFNHYSIIADVGVTPIEKQRIVSVIKIDPHTNRWSYTKSDGKKIDLPVPSVMKYQKEPSALVIDVGVLRPAGNIAVEMKTREAAKIDKLAKSGT